MREMTWLNKPDQFEPGRELYRSERGFTLWAYTVSHGQLLLRSPCGSDWRGRPTTTTIDILFKPVSAMNLQARYDGVVIRCATDEEAAAALGDLPGWWYRDDDRVIVLEANGTRGHVVCLALGWCEGVLASGEGGFFVHDPSPLPTRALDGIDSGLSDT
ncbi:hypothetical protein ACWEVD_04275 [Nocardia thailandica]|uniref:hypothetical protein n=1 Tax=Nocardia thailandica TaxID=257275 RepID=UPI000306378D|nr:hypothetical protein [Nocardia thailandica]